MKFFPTRNYLIELENDHSIAMTDLKNNTDLTSSLVSTWTKKSFRGQVQPNEFKLISSEIGRGTVCIFIGNFNGKEGTIVVRIHNAFKVMFSILLSFPIIGFGITAYSDNLATAINFIPTLLFALLFIRFVFIELSFRIISKTGLTKLTRILRVKEIIKTRHNNGEHEEPL